MLEGDVALYAQSISICIIRYDGCGADSGDAPAPLASQAASQAIQTRNNADYDKPGYVFDGWNRNFDGSGIRQVFGDIIYMPDDDIMLYAQRIPAYIIRFGGNGADSGDAPAPLAVF
jgi:uncharacterized repeat protein (TIGR02543 family)